MDNKNYFSTPLIFQLMRAEWLVAFVGLIVLGLFHLSEVRIGPAIALFVYIDLIGYIPGAIVTHYRSGPTPKVFYVLYNVMHSAISMGVVVAAWWLFIGPEWALLAVPLHLAADRGVNGNALKTFAVEFEPHRHPQFARFLEALRPAAELEAGTATGTTETATTSTSPAADPDLRIDSRAR